jgi:hypothetical protein
MLSLALGSGLRIVLWRHALARRGDTLVGFFIGAMIHAHWLPWCFATTAIRDPPALPGRFFIVPIVLTPRSSSRRSSRWRRDRRDVLGRLALRRADVRLRAHLRPQPRHTTGERRRLDFWMNQLLYAGPILAGATLMDHFRTFDSFGSIGQAFFASVPARVEGNARFLAWGVLAVGAGFVVFYVWMYWRLAQRGHRPPWLKVWLVCSTGFVSVYTWGFNSWGTAFLIMNLFHGVQYLALVWAMEGKRIATLLRMPARPRIVLGIYLGSVLAYGLGVQALDADLTVLWGITMVVSIMHFWYDAFVWSVRKAQI